MFNIKRKDNHINNNDIIILIILIILNCDKKNIFMILCFK
jgi:hypothetical protein